MSSKGLLDCLRVYTDRSGCYPMSRCKVGGNNELLLQGKFIGGNTPDPLGQLVNGLCRQMLDVC